MKILVILSRVPYPLEKGDKLRAFNQIRELSKKHQIILFALNDGKLDNTAIEELKKYCVAISVMPLPKQTVIKNLARSFFSGLPMQVGYFYFQKAQNKIDELIRKHNPDHIYCQLIRTAEYVKTYPQFRKTLDYMDVFSKGIERRKNTDPFYMKPLLSLEYKRLLKYEQRVFSWFTNKTIISSQDRELIPHPNKAEIKVIPNGVDTEFFKPIVRKKSYELLFNGNMNYPPNVESVEYLVDKVMPFVWSKMPTVKLLISGATPNSKVMALESDKVFISGWVDDVRENYAKCKILVAPMQISIGLQNKLLEAMAMQIPCVTSVLANNALGAKHNEQIMVADKPEQYALHIIELLQNEAKAKQIALNGYNFALNNFNWKKTTALLEGLMLKK
ncbi:MAG: glycosyltransferase [Bacteroidetes bacterium]|jgi:sugar transferase (PEP-CTERM/EpsH1 system associated)|nr:glycosyltransferase [Bacteroidota bacterium]